MLGNPEFDAGADPNIPPYVPSVPHDINGDPVELEALLRGTADGHSHLCKYMADKVARRQLVRQGNNGNNRRTVEEEEQEMATINGDVSN